MFKISNSAKTQTLECSRFRCHSTRISQTQSSCPRVTDEDRLLFENTQIKYQLKQLEEEFQIFKLQLRQSSSRKQGCKSLEVQNKQLELELLNKMKEIEGLKRNVNYTKYQELKIECKEYQRETLRLKKQIYQLNNLLNLKAKGVNFHELYEDLQQRIRKMHQENKSYTQQISQLQTENIKLKNQIEKLEIDNKHLDRENKKQLQLISQVQLPQQSQFKNRLQVYREELEGAKLQQKITELQQQIIEQQNYKEQYIQKLYKIIEEKDDQLKAYEIANPNQIMRQTTQTQQDILDSKYNDCVQNIQTQPSIVDDIVFEMPSCLNLARQPSIRKKVHQLEYQKSFQIDMTSINGFEDDMQEEYEEESDSEYRDEKTVRLPKVNYYDVEKIGKILKFQFMAKRIPWSYINQVFDCYEGDLKISEVKEILQKDPFSMQDQNQITLVSRYLVEDNTQDYVQFSVRVSNTVPIIKSVFRQLLGKYELFTADEKESCEQQLKVFFQKNFKYSSLDECENQECETIMKNYQSSVSNRTLEYLQMINYNLQGCVDKYCWKELLKQFCNIH